jgi:acyl carrier protein
MANGSGNGDSQTYAPPLAAPVDKVLVLTPTNGGFPAPSFDESLVETDSRAARPTKPNAQSDPNAQLDLNALMLRVVSEKTGYPAEMLTLDMELDNDLGIDSIKRVEIFATLMEQAPELQNLDTGELAKRASLGQIVAYIQEHLSGLDLGQERLTSEANSNGNEFIGTSVTSHPDLGAQLDLNALMLRVVSEKTGYPAEMLTLDMELDNDLASTRSSASRSSPP